MFCRPRGNGATQDRNHSSPLASSRRPRHLISERNTAFPKRKKGRRVALLRDWTKDEPPSAIDFTRYDLKADEPRGLQREWSLMNVLNQKGTRPQDKPRPLRKLAADDQRRIFACYPELKKWS